MNLALLLYTNTYVRIIYNYNRALVEKIKKKIEVLKKSC